eukprot:scaffold2764_cov399-Prasinococcus_capsulatus_cf.AAC.11
MEHIQKLDSLLKQASGGASLNQYECFHVLTALCESIPGTNKTELKSWQRKGEDTLFSILLKGVGPPLRRLVVEAYYQLLYNGDSISLYARVSEIQGVVGGKAFDKNSLSVRLGLLYCLGRLNKLFGHMLSGGSGETVALACKHATPAKNADLAVRHTALLMLRDVFEGIGEATKLESQEKALKLLDKLTGDKEDIIREATGYCYSALAGAGGAILFNAVAFDGVLSICYRALEDASSSVRTAFSEAFGVVSAVAVAKKEFVAKHPKRDKLEKQLEGGVKKLLCRPFAKAAVSGGNGRLVRVGLAMAWVHFLGAMRNVFAAGEEGVERLVVEAIQMLNGMPEQRGSNEVEDALVHSRACVLYIIKVGVLEGMGEDGQRKFLKRLLKLLSKASSNSDFHSTIVMLRSVCWLLQLVGEVSVAEREEAQKILSRLQQSHIAAVRCEASLAFRMLVAAEPSCANVLIRSAIMELTKMRRVKIDKQQQAAAFMIRLRSQAWHLAALLGGSPELIFGVPSALPRAALALAIEFIKNARPGIVGCAEKDVGFTVLCAVISSLHKEVLVGREDELVKFWTRCMPREQWASVQAAASQAAQAQHEFTWRSTCLQSMTLFLEKETLPEQSLKPFLSIGHFGLEACKDSFGSSREAHLLLLSVLQLFEAVPDAVLYQPSFTTLLWFSNALLSSNHPCEHALRKLLDAEDALLGPWAPGGDALEDSLVTFEGGGDSPLPKSWETPLGNDAETGVTFPQAEPLLLTVTSSSMRAFGRIYASMGEQDQLALLESLLKSLKNTGSSPRKTGAVNKKQCCGVNVAYALLSGMRVQAAKQSTSPSANVAKKIQEVAQALLVGSTPLLRRAAAELIGHACRVGGDSYATAIARGLATQLDGIKDQDTACALSLALACVHRTVGGMALSACVPSTTKALLPLITASLGSSSRVWALHSLTLTANASGFSFMPHVKLALKTALTVLLQDLPEIAAPGLSQCIARMVNASVVILGPELTPGSQVYQDCELMIKEVSSQSALEPQAQLECVMFAQQLVVFAPHASPTASHVPMLRTTLFSRQPALRLAAALTLRHFGEKDPDIMALQRIEADLFHLLNDEHNPAILRAVRMTLERLIEVSCPVSSLRILKLCSRLVMAEKGDSKEKNEGPKPGSGDDGAMSLDVEDEVVVADEAGAEDSAQEADSSGTELSVHAQDLAPRYRTRVFAAQCMASIPHSVGDDPRHFDLSRARTSIEQKPEETGRWLVVQLPELISIGYKVATGPVDALRPLGLKLLESTLAKFAGAQDPDFEGHSLIEQYQAQILAALRTVMADKTNPHVLQNGLQLCSRFLQVGLAAGDPAVIRRVVAMVTDCFADWKSLAFSFYAEAIGFRVRISLLSTLAQMRQYALSLVCLDEALLENDEAKAADDDCGRSLLQLLEPVRNMIEAMWIGLLRDFCVMHALPADVLSQYSPTLQESLSPGVASQLLSILSPRVGDILRALATYATALNDLARDDHSTVHPFAMKVAPKEYDLMVAMAMILMLDEHCAPSHVERCDLIENGVETESDPFMQKLSILESLRFLVDKSFVANNYLTDATSTELLGMLGVQLLRADSTPDELDEGHRKRTHQKLALEVMLSFVRSLSVDKLTEPLVNKICSMVGKFSSTLELEAASSDEQFIVNHELSLICFSILQHVVEKATVSISYGVREGVVAICLRIVNLKQVNVQTRRLVTASLTCLDACVGRRVRGQECTQHGEDYETLFVKTVVSLKDTALRIVEDAKRTGVEVSKGCTEVLTLISSSLCKYAARDFPASDPKMTPSLVAFSSFFHVMSGALDPCTSTGICSAAMVVLRSVVAAGVSENPRGSASAWARKCLIELGPAAAGVIYAFKSTDSEQQGTVASEIIKIFVASLKLAEDDRGRTAIMSILLPMLIHVTIPTNTNVFLTALALQLITGLAKAYEAAFRVAVSRLASDTKQQLQVSVLGVNPTVVPASWADCILLLRAVHRRLLSSRASS